jgi:hypothetical protein
MIQQSHSFMITTWMDKKGGGRAEKERGGEGRREIGCPIPLLRSCSE